MTIYYFDPSDTGSLNTGTLTEPFNTVDSMIAAAQSANGNIIYCKDDTFGIHSLAAGRLDYWEIPAGLNNIQLLRYGNGTYPCIFRGDFAVTGWSLVSGNIYSKSGMDANIGVAMQNLGGHLPTPLTWKATQGAMTEGSYYHDTAANTLYVWQFGGGSPTGITVATQRRFASALSGNSGWRIEVGMCGYSRLAMNAENWTDSVWDGCYIRNCGGAWNGSTRLGGGLQNSKGCKNLTYQNCDIQQVWDSPLSTQFYNSSAADIENIHYFNNTLGYAAGGGYEFSHWNDGNRIRGLLVRGGTITGMGAGYSGGGDAGWLVPCGVFITVSGNPNTSIFERIDIEDLVIDSPQDSAIYTKRMTGTLNIARVTAIGGQYGLRHEDSVNTSLRPSILAEKCRITGASVAGINVSSAYATSDHVFDRMTLDSNAIGLRCQNSGSGSVRLKNSQVTNNTTGLSRTGGTLLHDHCNLFGNTTATSGTMTGTNASAVDPQYVNSGTGDFAPQNTAALGDGSAVGSRGIRGNKYVTDDIGAYAAVTAGINDFQEIKRYATDVTHSGDTTTFTFEAGAIKSGESITTKYTRPDERLDMGLWAACRQSNLTTSNNTPQYAWAAIQGLGTVVESLHDGLLWYPEPKAVNPAPGIWDFTGVVAALDYIHSLGLKAGLDFRLRSFNNSTTYNPFPSHVCQTPLGVVDKQDQTVLAYDYSPDSGGGWQTKIWERNCIDWLKEMFSRLYDAVGDHPALAFVSPRETSVANADVVITSYTSATHRDGYLEVFTFASKLFADKIVYVRPNFLAGNQSYVGQIIDGGVKWGLHAAVTDVLQAGSLNAGISYTTLDQNPQGPSGGSGIYDFIWRNAQGKTEIQAQEQNHTFNDTVWSATQHAQFAIANTTSTPSGVQGLGAQGLVYFWQSATNADQLGLYDYVASITWETATPPIVPNFVNSAGTNMADGSDTAVAA